MKTSKIAAFAMLAATALAGCAGRGGPGGPGGPGGMRNVAQPGEVVAAEIALNHAAQDDGQWKAWRQQADGDAIFFVPGPVIARDWMQTRGEPDRAAQLMTQEIWSSCDGSLSVSFGAYRGNTGATGWYSAAWSRGRKEYEWTMMLRDETAAAPPAPDIIKTHTPGCNSFASPFDRASRDRPAPPPAGAPGNPSDLLVQAEGPANPSGISDDRTLRWSVRTGADCTQTISVWLRPAAKRDEPQPEWGQPAFTRTAAPQPGTCK